MSSPSATAPLLAEITEHQFIRPTASMLELRNQINVAVERRSNQRSAIAAMVDEQASRDQMRRMSMVLDTLVATRARKAAAAAERHEQTYRVAMNWRHEIMDELRRNRTTVDVAKLTEAERAAQIAEPATTNASSELRTLLKESIDRRGGRAKAIESMEAERSDRVHASNMNAICDEMVRTVARMAARTAADDEQAERITANTMHAVCEEVRRVHAASNARRATAAEQQRQIAERSSPDSWTVVTSADDATALAWYYGDMITASNKAAVNEMIVRMGNRTAATAAMEDERANRMIQSTMREVCEQLERSYARTTAARLADDEQTYRIAMAARHDVCAEVRSTTSRAASKTAAHIAQEQLVAATYAPRPDTHHELLEAIARRGGATIGVAAMEAERDRRVHEHTMHHVCDDLRRAVAAKTAVEATETERAQRVAIDAMHTICEELRRTVNVELAISLADGEQRRRVAEHDRAEAVGAHFASDLTFELLEEIQRMGNEKTAIEAMDSEKVARIQRDRMHDAMHELVRRAGQQTAKRAMEVTQAHEIARQHGARVMESLLLQHKRKEATVATDIERASRVLNAITMPDEFPSMLAEIRSVAAAATAAAC